MRTFRFLFFLILVSVGVDAFGQATTANYSYSSPVCGTLTVSFNNNSINGNSYKWDFGDPASGASNIITTASMSAQSHTFSAYGLYNVTLTSYGSVDTNNKTTQVRVSPLPPVFVFPNSFANFCQGDTGVFIFLSATADPAYKYNWTPTTGFRTASNISSVQINPKTTTTYTCTVIDTVTGCTNFKSVTVNFVACSLIGNFTFVPPVCGQTSVTFTNISGGAHHFKWYFGDPGSGAANFFQNQDVNQPVTHTFSASGVFTVSMVAFDSLETKRDSVVRFVTIFTTPNAKINTANTTICLGDSIQLSSTGGGNYAWSPKIGLSDTSISNPWAKPTVTTSYILKVWFSPTCFDYDTVTITVDTPPLVSAGPDDTICRGNSTTLSAITLGSGYLWNTGATTKTISVNPSSTTKYWVRAGSGSCFGPADTVVVVVDTVGKAGFTATPLSGEVPLNVTFTNTSSGASSYFWSFGDGTTSTAKDPSHTYMKDGNMRVVLTITNARGCKDSVSIIIIVETGFSIQIPNVFTPNKDGVNDFFDIKQTGVSEYSIAIFNRWGQTVYSSNDLSKPWDGTINGIDAVEGVYYYVIDILDTKNRERKYKGDLTLIRKE